MFRREIPLTIAYKTIRYSGYFLCVIFMGFSVCMVSRKPVKPVKPREVPANQEEVPIEWGSSPPFFSPYKPSYSFPFEEVQKEILFLGTTMQSDKKILLSIQQSGARKLVASGEKVYLIYREGKLHFSEGETPLILSVQREKANWLAVSLSLDAAMSPLCNGDNIYRFVKPKEDRYAIADSDSLRETPMFRTLQKAKWWGVDYLLLSTPNPEIPYGNGKQRIEFTYDDRGEIVLLDLGESLVWGKKGWHILPLPNGDRQPHYVIRIKEIHRDALELILWDTHGLPLHTFFLPLSTTCNELPSVEILSNIKRRTRTVASFLLGKTRVIMKKGDLAIETPFGWKITHTQEEKSPIFSHQLLGSLLAFDGMEREGTTLYFTGRILDPMRTCYQPIRIPILQNKRKEKKTPSNFPQVQVSSIGDE